MKNLNLSFVIIAIFLSSLSVYASKTLASNDSVLSMADIEKIFIGKHMCSLQWISWEKFGTAEFYYEGDKIRCTGGQESDPKGDYLYFDGYVDVVDDRNFTFRGEVVTCVSHINGGEPVLRQGVMHFKATGKRKYWRMQEINNPKDFCADYVDIYFK